MHPLEATLDENWHGKEIASRRRSSLDCQASLDVVRNTYYMADNDDGPRRRLSLQPISSRATTFLATSTIRPRVELDTDWHASQHSGQLSKQPSYAETPTVSSNLDESESSLESECDSFCDASVQEPANREYLRRDLGASCMWSSDDSIDFAIYENPYEDINDNEEGPALETHVSRKGRRVGVRKMFGRRSGDSID